MKQNMNKNKKQSNQVVKEIEKKDEKKKKKNKKKKKKNNNKKSSKNEAVKESPPAKSSSSEEKKTCVVELTKADVKKMLIEELGRGGNGKVEKVLFNGEIMALKTFFIKDLDNLLSEAHVHERLAGAGGAPILRAVCHKPPRMIMSFTGKGYEEYLRHCSSDDCRVESLFQIAQKLHEIHEKSILHNDLKRENVTVTGHKCPQFHIIDFGWSSAIGESLGIKSKLKWHSPELKKDEPLTAASDVFSFGFLIADVWPLIKHKGVRRYLQRLQEKVTEDDPLERPQLSTLISNLGTLASRLRPKGRHLLNKFLDA